MKWYENLKNLRVDHDMSRKELAEKLNISERSLYRYETGECEPTISLLIAISKEFNISIDYIAGIDDTTISHDNRSVEKLLEITKSLNDLVKEINNNNEE